MAEFMFATGIENSNPTVPTPDGGRRRVDEMELTCHYRNWRKDFQLCKELGINYLRYGVPNHKVHIGPGKYDWEFSDLAFNALKEMDINVIADLCHFGVPDWIGDFQNDDWPPYFAEYAEAFGKRYPWIDKITPVNEMMVASTFSALYGWWNEAQKSDRAFVRALRNITTANVMAMERLVDLNPEMMFIQSESTEYYHAENPKAMDLAYFLNERRFLALDLTYSFPITAKMYCFLLDNGMSEKEYRWLEEHHVRANCVMGNDYYVRNEHLVHADGSTSPSGEIFGYYVITRQYFDRYRMRIMHTETNCEEPEAVHWLKRSWANAHRLREDGIDLIGFTWYSLIDQVDWDTAMTQPNGRDNALGLCDLDRHIRPVGHAYKKLIEEWGPALPIEDKSLNQRRW